MIHFSILISFTFYFSDRRCLLLGCLLTLLLIFGTRALEIECEFKIEKHVIGGDVYTCKAIKSIVTTESEIVESVTGTHLSGKTNGDVKVFDVDNQVFKFVPSDIENFFPNLMVVKIVSSGLKQLSSESFKYLPELKFIDFTDNEIEMLNGDLFEFNSKLQDIKFDSNKIKGIGSEIFENLDELQKISLLNNDCINGQFESRSEIADLKVQVVLKCAKIIKKTFRLFTTHDGFSETSGGSDGSSHHITTDGDGSPGTRFTKITKFNYNFDEDDEENNEITCDLAQSSWKFSAVELQTCSIPIQLVSHQGYNIKISDTDASDVKALNFSGNENLKFLPQNLGATFPNLVELAAKGTRLENIGGGAFKGLNKLKFLSLQNSDFQVIEKGTFEGLDALEVLDLSDGNLRYIEEGAFDGLKSLKAIFLCGNKIHFLQPRVFNGMTELRNVSIELNHLTDLDENLFSTNTKLTNLWLSGNKIKNLPVKTFEGLSSLSYVDLQGNECIDKVYDTAIIEEMKIDVDKNCTSLVSVKRIFKKVHINGGDVETKHKIRNEYNIEVEEEEYEDEIETITEVIKTRQIIKKKKKVVEDNADNYDYDILATVSESNTEESILDKETIDGPNVAMKPNIEVSKASEPKAPESSYEQTSKFCKFNDVHCSFSGSNMKTCVVSNVEIENKGFEIPDTDEDSEVKAFIMKDNKAVKFLPENLGKKFKNLVELSAQNSSLITLSRKNFEGLENLKSLNLGNNNIKFIEPDTFDDLKNLEELDISSNQMEYIDENLFMKLKNLKALRLGGNKLHFVHGKLFRNNRNLRNVSISSNQLSAIDDNLFKTNSKLQNIWIHNNKIKSLNPKVFGSAKMLDYVDLRDNKCIDAVYVKADFEGMKKDLQEKCGSTYTLNHGKKVKVTKKMKKKIKVKVVEPRDDDELKEVTCENEEMFWPSLNETLLTCVISSDQIIDGPDYMISVNAPSALPLVDSDTVQAISIANNKKIKFLPQNIHETFPNLIAMSAAGDSLETISKNNFKNLKKLKSLNLSGNQIKTFDGDSFEDLTSLEDLSLDDNELEIFEVTTFVTTRKLKKVKFGKITKLNPEIFETMTELVEVSFDVKDDSEVTADWFKSNLNLTQVKFNGKIVDKSLNPIEINEVEVTIKPTHTETVTTKPEVPETVQVVSCHFKEEISHSNGEEMFTCEISDADLSGDLDFVIEESSELKRVKRFNLNNKKKVKNLPENLWQTFPELVEITAVNSSLTGVNKKNLQGLKNLQFLNLSSNKIKHLEPDTFDDLELLIDFDASNNEMEIIDEFLFDKSKSLKDLNLSSNKIHYVHPKTFKNLDNLENLNLSANLLSVVEPSTFKNNRKLRKVDLSENKIETISSRIVDGLKDFKSINLKGNKCVDEIYEGPEFAAMKKLLKENCKRKTNKLEDEPTEIFCHIDTADKSCTVEDQVIESSHYIVLPDASDDDTIIEKLVFKGPGIKHLPNNISFTFPDVNEISSIDSKLDSISKENFVNLPKLKTLKLKSVESIDPDTFEDLGELTTLEIETESEDIDDDTFSPLESIETFHFASKTRKRIPTKWFENFEEVVDVKLVYDPDEYEEITEISTILKKKKKLKKFDVNGDVVVDEPEVEVDSNSPERKTESSTDGADESKKPSEVEIDKKPTDVDENQKPGEVNEDLKAADVDWNQKPSNTGSAATKKNGKPKDVNNNLENVSNEEQMTTMDSVIQTKTTEQPKPVGANENNNLRTTTKAPKAPKTRMKTTRKQKPTRPNEKSVKEPSSTTATTTTEKPVEPSSEPPHEIQSERPARPTAPVPEPNEIPCALGYHDWPKTKSTLITCDLSNQSIDNSDTKIQKNPYATVIEGLLIENNKNAKFLPENMNPFVSLRELSAKNSSIEAIYKDDFENLRELKNLDLSDNKIVSIEPETFAHLPSLEQLDMSNNAIDYIDETAFVNLKNLKALNLKGNKIAFIHPKTFESLPELEEVILEGNNLPTDFLEQEEIFRNNPKLKNVISGPRYNLRPTTTKIPSIYNPRQTLEAPCRYTDTYWDFANSNLFTCNLEEFIENPAMVIKPSPRNPRVKALNFVDNKEVQFLPQNMAQTFPNLVAISGFNSSVEAIPRETFKDLRKVKYLNLAKTNLREIDPDTFIDMAELEELDLSDNKIDSFDESTFKNLPSLTTLYLGGNNLKKLPAGILNNLPNLRNISLENNKFESIDPELFKNNKNLENVWLNGNKIRNLSPSIFNGLNKLDYVDLQGNGCVNKYYEGTEIAKMQSDISRYCRNDDVNVERQTFRPDTKPSIPRHHENREVSCDLDSNDWPKLYCDIVDKTIDEPDYTIKPFEYAPYVTGIRVEGRNVKFLPKNIAEVMPNVETVWVKNTFIDKFDPATLVPMKNLKTLSLPSNKLKEVDPQHFNSLPGVQTLDLSHNRIKKIGANAFSDNLETLNLANNEIEFISPEALKNLPRLMEINLEGNNLPKVPSELFNNNPSLQKIALSGNRISSLDSKTFENLPDLRSVDLEENSCISGNYNPATFRSLKNEILRNCRASPTDYQPGFNSITDEDNSQKRVDPNEQIEIDDPKKISCQFTDTYSPLTRYEVRTCLVKLQIIDGPGYTFNEDPENENVWKMILNDNKNLEYLPENIGEMFPNLLELQVANASVKEITPENLKNLPRLRDLDLSGNDIIDIKPKTFDELPELDTLNLSKNKLKAFTDPELPNLSFLNLEDNQLSFLHPKAFSKLPSLKEVNLANNKLTNVEGNTFMHNPQLENINLNQNLLISINPKTFDPLKRLKRLDLEGNKCIDQVVIDQQIASLESMLQHNCQPKQQLQSQPQPQPQQPRPQPQPKPNAQPINLPSCLREKAVCEKRLSANPSNVKLDQFKKENEKLRNILKKMEIKIGLLNGNQKKLRNAVNYEKHLGKKLKDKIKEIEIDNANKFCGDVDESSFKLQCNFEETSDGNYACKAKNLNVEKENSTIRLVTGEPVRGKQNSDVTSLIIADQTMYFLPENIHESFPRLEKLSVLNSDLRQIDPEGLKPLRGLTALIINGNNISKIGPKSFDNNKKLEIIDLSGNNLHDLPSKAFEKLENLHTLNLNNNKLSSLDADMIPSLNQINEINLNDNLIDSIDPRLFKRLKRVKSLNLHRNKCIDKSFAGNYSDLLMILGEIAMKCSNDDDKFCPGRSLL